MEIFDILICFLTVFYIANIVHIGIEMWQVLPIKEERSTPIYITKVIE